MSATRAKLEFLVRKYVRSTPAGSPYVTAAGLGGFGRAWDDVVGADVVPWADDNGGIRWGRYAS
eukprot:1476792-Pyramimonas_sp.AAC.1